MCIIGSLSVIVGDTDIRSKLDFYQDNFRHIQQLDMGEDSRVTLSEPKPYRKHTNKGVYTAKGEENCIHDIIYIHNSCSNSRFMLAKIT